MIKDSDQEKLLHESLENRALEAIPADANLWPRISSRLMRQRHSFGARLIPTTAGAWICAGLVLLLIIVAAGYGGAVAAERLFTSAVNAEQLNLRADSTIELGQSQILNGVTITLDRAYIFGNLIGVEYTVSGMPKPYRDEEGRYHQFEPSQETLAHEMGTALKFTGATAVKGKSGNIDTSLPVFDSSAVRDYGPDLYLSFSVLIKEIINEPDSTDPENQVRVRVDPVAGPYIFNFTATLPDVVGRVGRGYVFVDPKLEAAIRKAMGKPEGAILDSDLTSLTSLDAKYSDITNLTGLEYCINLTDLNLFSNDISDLTPLANLTKLTKLDLGNNDNSINIAPLANLTDLKELSFASNWMTVGAVRDLSPLANLTGLTTLELESCYIRDISALANLINLTYLGLGRNMTTGNDLIPLVNLVNLKVLSLYNTPYSGTLDIAPLVDNPGLSKGDTLWLRSYNLSSNTLNTYIPQLQARGVDVRY